jgi:hypothetical protein
MRLTPELREVAELGMLLTQIGGEAAQLAGLGLDRHGP